MRSPMASFVGLTVGLSALLAWGSTAWAAASLTATPSPVSAGGSITFSGNVPNTGTASCAPGDAATLTSTAAFFPPDGFGPMAPRDASGNFQITYAVPSSTVPNTYTVGIRCGGGNTGVGIPVIVTAQVSQVPSGAPQAGLGGASSRGKDAIGWLAGAAVAAVAAVAFGLTTRSRRRRATASGSGSTDQL
jgi:hypothetical protein